MSDTLRTLGQYSAAMASGDAEAVYEFFSPDFHSHVAERVPNGAPEGEDVRGSEQEGWSSARAAFPDLRFRVVPPSGEPVTINGTAILRVRARKIVEHWGGPHCQRGIGLVRTAD